jgi:hypothetical protein
MCLSTKRRVAIALLALLFLPGCDLILLPVSVAGEVTRMVPLIGMPLEAAANGLGSGVSVLLLGEPPDTVFVH